MKSLILSALLVGSVCAQSLAGLPACAYSCVANSIPASCNLDPKCICSASTFIAGVTCCVAKVCSVADQEATLKYAKGICTPAGVTLTQTSAVCASTSSEAAASGAVESTSKPSSVSSATSSVGSGALASTSSTPASMSSSPSSVVSTTTSSEAGSASSAAVGPATSAAGAGQLLVQRGGDIFAAVVAAAALL